MYTHSDDLELGELAPHDKLQVELKSDFLPVEENKTHVYVQEFYLFIPNSLQINSESYPKEEFYQDITNFIRYKTPAFTLAELVDDENEKSPLHRLGLIEPGTAQEKFTIIDDELKLLGNVVRSSLRDKVKFYLNHKDQLPKLAGELTILARDLQIFREKFYAVYQRLSGVSTHIQKELDYLDNFISMTFNQFLTLLLESIRLVDQPELAPIETALTAILVKEKRLRSERFGEPVEINKGDATQGELLAYRNGLLNKFVLDALQLNIKRSSIDESYRNWAGTVAAAIAMLIYLLFFLYLGRVFVIDSLPFLFITVSLYVLKDRIKEGLKSHKIKKFFNSLADYRTELWTPNNKHFLGNVKEWFTFLNEHRLPAVIGSIRNREFHTVLEEFKRPEQVIYYKRTVHLPPQIHPTKSRRFAFNTILRLNIHRFIRKASDPTVPFVSIDPETKKLVGSLLPKVYHVNIIMKTTTRIQGQKEEIDFRKIRLIIDKNGIKRIEQIAPNIG